MFQWDKHRWFISRTEANKLVKLGYNASTIKLHYFRLSCTVRSGLLSAMRRAIKFHGGADAPSSPLKLSSLWSTAINFLFLNPLIKQILLYRLFFLLFCLLPPLSKKISPLFSCFPTCTRCLFVILWEDFRHFPTRKKFCYHPISSVDHPHTDHYFRLLCTVGSGLLSAMRRAIKFHGGADDANFPTRKKILLPSSAVWVAAALAINTS